MVVHAAPSPRRLLACLLVAVFVAAGCKPGDDGATPTSAATIAVGPTGEPSRLSEPVRVTPSRAATTVAR